MYALIEMNKAYIVFTCATTRAIYLELVPNMSAESFLSALIRFKGSHTLIASDNGKTFKDSRVQVYCQRECIKCRFIVEAAPRWGGFFEWMVKSVKLSLKKCLLNAQLNFVELPAALIEVEAVLNSWPLTCLYDEMEEPLTPSHLIIGHRILSRHQEALLMKLAAKWGNTHKKGKVSTASSWSLLESVAIPVSDRTSWTSSVF